MEDNITCKDHDEVHHLHLVWNAGVLVVALPLNLTALGIFLCAYRLRTVVTIYMANLATCDLLFTLALPLRIYYYAAHHWPLGNLLCQLAGSLFQINLYGSCLFLACINVDRLLALAYPLRARHLHQPRVAWQVCAGVWTLIVLGSIPVALVHDTSQCLGANGTTEVRCFESFSPGDWKKKLLPLLALAEILGFLLPLAVVLWCSARTLRALYAARRLVGRPARGLRPTTQRRAVQLLLVNALIFVVCFVPYNIVLAAYSLTKAKVVSSTPGSRASLRLALQLTMLLTCTNCLLDPLVYYFTTEGFRNTLKSRRGRTTTGQTERVPLGTERRSKAGPPRTRLSLEQEATSPGWEEQALRGRGSNEWGESVI